MSASRSKYVVMKQVWPTFKQYYTFTKLQIFYYFVEIYDFGCFISFLYSNKCPYIGGGGLINGGQNLPKYIF